MRAVIATDQGVVEVNWMWLPTWIGMNAKLKKEIEDKLKEEVVGRTTGDDDLEAIHGRVLEYLQEKFRIQGLDDYLDGLKFIQLP